MSTLPKKLLLGFITAALGALAVVAPAFAGWDINHNETFVRDEE